MSESLDVEKVKTYLRGFAKERDREQFHTPKNLVMALAGEVGELTEIFQWLTPEESVRIMKDTEKGEAVWQELADVLQYVIRLSDVLGIDIEQALWKKLTSFLNRPDPTHPPPAWAPPPVRVRDVPQIFTLR